jgi:hypothetical protein
MRSVMRDAVSNPINKVRDEVQELKEDQQRLMSEIRTEIVNIQLWIVFPLKKLALGELSKAINKAVIHP